MLEPQLLTIKALLSSKHGPSYAGLGLPDPSWGVGNPAFWGGPSSPPASWPGGTPPLDSNIASAMTSCRSDVTMCGHSNYHTVLPSNQNTLCDITGMTSFPCDIITPLLFEGGGPLHFWKASWVPPLAKRRDLSALCWACIQVSLDRRIKLLSQIGFLRQWLLLCVCSERENLQSHLLQKPKCL